MKAYSVRLEGVEAFDLSALVLRDLCDFLVEGAQRSARLAVEGRSVVRGAAPTWLAAIADLRIVRYEAGSVSLEVHAPRLHDLAPEVFCQQTLFGTGPDLDASALDLLLDAMGDAAQGRRDSERLDSGVLEVLTRAGQLFARGGTRLTIGTPSHAAVVLDPESLRTIRTLSDETPSPRVTRARGILDSMTVSSKAAVLRLADGRTLRGFVSSVAMDDLKQLLGHDVVVEGVTTFKPSGDALRIDIDSVARATERDILWAKLPHVTPSGVRPRLATAGDSLDPLFGAWPGDESDEELAAALAEIA